ncbi:MAG TPA: PepSY-associated TM helix domain-containing protein [Sphingomonas sp.]|nr:PepSY-associated TM helix domain-containing protein [Sphingomonas sp.]
MTPPVRPKRRWRSWYLKQLHTWHWVSAAISLVAMLLFAVTGITLNHAATISATPVTVERTGTLPAPLVAQLAGRSGAAPLPIAVADAVRTAVDLDTHERAGEWSDGEVYVALPRPGGDGWVSIDRTSGAITAETTDRGWISYLNDLHKGRNAGTAWFWFIDIFAVACVLFTLTGLLLLHLHARHRPSTWPIVIAGLVLPALIAIFLIH